MKKETAKKLKIDVEASYTFEVDDLDEVSRVLEKLREDGEAVIVNMEVIG